MIRNLIWMGFSALTFVGIFLGKAWAPKATLGGGIIIFLWSVLDRLLLARSDYALKSILPSLIVYTLGLTAVLWLLNRPSAREYFEEKVHE